MVDLLQSICANQQFHWIKRQAAKVSVKANMQAMVALSARLAFCVYGMPQISIARRKEDCGPLLDSIFLRKGIRAQIKVRTIHRLPRKGAALGYRAHRAPCRANIICGAAVWNCSANRTILRNKERCYCQGGLKKDHKD
jgi:hypothetical protein